MNAYADSSFIVSIYLTDLHSLQADTRLRRNPGAWITPFHRCEFVHAVEQNVFRRKISSSEAKVIHHQFQDDCNAGVWLQTEWPERTFEIAIQLAIAHIAVTGTRTLDTLHVAAALELHATEFWTFDDRQAKLAQAAGLNVS